MKSLLIVILLSLSGQAHALRPCKYNVYDAGTPAQLQTFLDKLKKVKTAKQLAPHVNFPMTVNLKPKKLVIKNRADLNKHYKKIITEKVRSHIYYADPKKVYCNKDGVMIGKGHVWLKVFNKQYKIISINP